MRVTSNTFTNDLLDQLNTLTSRQAQLQNQAASGQRIQSPEDDPGAARRVLDLQTEGAAVAQYQKNIARQQEQATASYSAMKSLKTVSDRANEIAILADGLKSPLDLPNYASEVTSLIKQAVQWANTKDQGNYLFAGTLSNQPPFAMTTDAAGHVTAVTYQGNTTLAESEIAESVTTSAQTTGENATGSGPRGLIADSRVGADLFNHLISLQNNLLSANSAAISATDVPALAKDEDNLLFHFSANGAVQARLEASASMAANRGSSLQKLVSGEADADLAQTLVRLNQTQTAYQAALQSAGKVLSMSLLDFLH